MTFRAAWIEFALAVSALLGACAGRTIDDTSQRGGAAGQGDGRTGGNGGQSGASGSRGSGASAGTGGGAGRTCAAIVECAVSCPATDSTCQGRCLQGADPQALLKVGAVLRCAVVNNCLQNVACLSQKCSKEFALCLAP